MVVQEVSANESTANVSDEENPTEHAAQAEVEGPRLVNRDPATIGSLKVGGRRCRSVGTLRGNDAVFCSSVHQVLLARGSVHDMK